MIKPFHAYQSDVIKSFAVVMNAIIKRIDCMLFGSVRGAPWSMRGAVVEWLEAQLRSESRCKIMSSRLGFTMGRLENSVNSAVNGYLFELGKAKAAKEEGWASPFINCAQIQWDSNPHCLYSY